MSHSYKRLSNTNNVNRAFVTHSYIFWDGLFTNEELDKIIELSNTAPLEDGLILNDKLSDDYRISKNNFHNPNENNGWIFNRLNGLIDHVNDQFFNFDLNGYEYYQYSEYSADRKGHYNWHTDMATDGKNLASSTPIDTRKLSLSVILNEPDVDFKGGEFFFRFGDEDTPTEAKRGRIFFFPSYTLHKVAPVTEGVRKSLVVWVTGPKFR